MNRQLMNRLSIVSIVFSAFCGASVAYESSLLAIVYIPLFLISVIPVVKIHGMDIRKWWFLWRGPLLSINFKASASNSLENFERVVKVEMWLKENLPQDDWRLVYDFPYSFIKFRYKRDAIIFKLSYD